MAQIIKRGVIQAFNAGAWTANVLLLEATSAVLVGVPINNALNSSTAIVGASCAVLFFDEHNPTDAVVLAVYPNQSQGVPTGAGGGSGITFITPIAQISAVTILSGTTQTFTLSGLPASILGVLFKAYFNSTVVPAHIDLAAHGGSLSGTATVGDIMYGGSGNLNGIGIVPVDAANKIDIRANGSDCTVWLYTYGYIS